MTVNVPQKVFGCREGRKKRKFFCHVCEAVFESEYEIPYRERVTARPLDYWRTDHGYVAKCQYCLNYAVGCNPPIECYANEKEEHTMQVSYNGFTGELVKLERKSVFYVPGGSGIEYELSIYDTDKKATISFNGVKLSDVKFLGGKVSFE